MKDVYSGFTQSQGVPEYLPGSVRKSRRDRLPSDVSKWTKDKIGVWLDRQVCDLSPRALVELWRSCGTWWDQVGALGKVAVGAYKARFDEYKIGGSELVTLEEEDLKGVGVSEREHRRHLLKEIARLSGGGVGSPRGERLRDEDEDEDEDDDDDGDDDDNDDEDDEDDADGAEEEKEAREKGKESRLVQARGGGEQRVRDVGGRGGGGGDGLVVYGEGGG
eukprot:489334-Rhodomonas_salina.1